LATVAGAAVLLIVEHRLQEPTTSDKSRNGRVAQILIERRREMQDDVGTRIRHGLTEETNMIDTTLRKAGRRGDIELALLQGRRRRKLRGHPARHPAGRHHAAPENTASICAIVNTRSCRAGIR